MDVFTKMEAWGQLAAASASVVGLYAIWDQVRIARKSADLQTLQSFVKGVSDAEAALQRKDDGTAHEQAFIEWLNFLETYAGAINGRLCHGMSAKLIKDKLISSIAAVENAVAWKPKVEAATSTDSTFEELRRFVSRNRSAIHRAALSMKRFDVSTSSTAQTPDNA